MNLLLLFGVMGMGGKRGGAKIGAEGERVRGGATEKKERKGQETIRRTLNFPSQEITNPPSPPPFPPNPFPTFPPSPLHPQNTFSFLSPPFILDPGKTTLDQTTTHPCSSFFLLSHSSLRIRTIAALPKKNLF